MCTTLAFTVSWLLEGAATADPGMLSSSSWVQKVLRLLEDLLGVNAQLLGVAVFGSSGGEGMDSAF